MMKPGASSSPPRIGFGTGDTRLDEGDGAAMLADGRASPATVAPVTVPAAVRTNRRLPKTLPMEVPAMRLLSLDEIVELFGGGYYRTQTRSMHYLGRGISPDTRGRFATISGRIPRVMPRC